MATLSPCSTHAEDLLAARLPAALQPLAAVAANLWWSWQPDAADVFWTIDPERWEASGENPVKFLRDGRTARLLEASRDRRLVGRVEALGRALVAELGRALVPVPGATVEHPVAFLCAEYGLHPSLRTAGTTFTTRRMVGEYEDRMYRPPG